MRIINIVLNNENINEIDINSLYCLENKTVFFAATIENIL